MSRITLGILTLYLNQTGTLEERKIFEHMTIEGEKLNMNIVIFTPSDVKAKKVLAHQFDIHTKKWNRKWINVPTLVFDRCRIQKSPRMNELRKFKTQFSHINFLNKPIGNKWTMHQMLYQSSHIRNYLPETIKFTNIHDLVSMIKKHGVVYFKPVNGTGGRGILRIEKKSSKNMIHIEGRDHNRRIITPRMISVITLGQFISKWNVTQTSYLVQQGINLTLSNGRVHDYRILVQKDGNGEWTVTGGAGRIGAARSITANLHGGGSAIEMTKLMRTFIDSTLNLVAIQEEINDLVVGIPQYLESKGYQLCELAIDLAIDQLGKIWIIELNPKPAREVFREIGELEQYTNAIKRPLEYAIYKHSSLMKNR